MIFTPDRRLAAAAFIVAAVYVPGIFSASFIPHWWAIAVLLPLASDLDPTALPGIIGLFLITGILWAAGSLAWTPSPYEGGLDVVFLALLALTMIAAANVNDVTPALLAIGLAVTISSAICVAAYFGYLVDVQNSGRGGLFLSTEILAETAAPLIVWALWRRFWPLAAALAPILIICNSRIAVAAVVIGLWWGWRPRRRVFKAAVLLAAIIVLPLIVAAFGPGKFASGMTRFVLWGAGLFSVTPLGRGIGWWSVAHPGAFEGYVHSDALQLLVELGIGALPLLAVPIILLWKGGGDDAERSTFAVLIFESAVSFPLQIPVTAFIAAIIAGRLARSSVGLRRPRLSRGADVLSDIRRPPSPGGVVVSQLALGPRDVPVRSSSQAASGRDTSGLRRANPRRDQG